MLPSAPSGQERALAENAEIFLQVCEECITRRSAPRRYGKSPPGCLVLLAAAGCALRQIEIIRRCAPPDLLLVANTGGVMAMPGAENYVSFAYLLHDNPEEVDAMAERSLQGGLQAARRFRDLGMDIAVTASDVADNHGPYMRPADGALVWPYLRRWPPG